MYINTSQLIMYLSTLFLCLMVRAKPEWVLCKTHTVAVYTNRSSMSLMTSKCLLNRLTWNTSLSGNRIEQPDSHPFNLDKSNLFNKYILHNPLVFCHPWDSRDLGCTGNSIPRQKQTEWWHQEFREMVRHRIRAQRHIVTPKHKTETHRDSRTQELPRLCVWSWLESNPANMEISRSSRRVIRPYQEFFLFFSQKIIKSWFFSGFDRFFHGCCGET